MRVNGHSEQSARQEMGKTIAFYTIAALSWRITYWKSQQSYSVPSVMTIRAYFQLNVSIVDFQLNVSIVTETYQMFRKKGSNFRN